MAERCARPRAARRAGGVVLLLDGFAGNRSLEIATEKLKMSDYIRRGDAEIEKLSDLLTTHIADDIRIKEKLEIELTEIKQLRADFFIAPKDHYDTHKRLDRLLDVYDAAGNAFTKALIGLFIMGILVVAAAGSWWHK